MINKKGQITIWVILAVVLAASLLIFFNFSKIKTVVNTAGSTDPSSFIDRCVRESTNEIVDKMLPQGGFISPTNYKVYKNINVSYLCQNVGNYLTCINQHPVLISEMRAELGGELNPKIESCFSDFRSQMGKRKIDVVLGEQKFEVTLTSNRIIVNIDRKVSITEGQQKRNFDKFKVVVQSPAYDLAGVAGEIASQEAKYCYFEYVGYMILYQRFRIEKVAMSDSTKIYTITDKYSNKEMNIAIRSCAIPAGI